MTVSFSMPNVMLLIGIILTVGTLIVDSAQKHERVNTPPVPEQILIWAFMAGVGFLAIGTLIWIFTIDVQYRIVAIVVGVAALAVDAWVLWYLREYLPPQIMDAIARARGFETEDTGDTEAPAAPAPARPAPAPETRAARAYVVGDDPAPTEKVTTKKSDRGDV